MREGERGRRGGGNFLICERNVTNVLSPGDSSDFLNSSNYLLEYDTVPMH